MLLCHSCLQYFEIHKSHDTTCPGCGCANTVEYDSQKYIDYWGSFIACENRWKAPVIRVLHLGKMPIRKLYLLLSSIPDREYCNELGITIPNPYKRYAVSRK